MHKYIELITDKQKLDYLHTLIDKRGNLSSNLNATERVAYNNLTEWYNATQNPV